MVKQIVEQHGGAIELSSELGVGTRALVRLPLPSSQEIAA
jgi:signal transduction histidine kinase